MTEVSNIQTYWFKTKCIGKKFSNRIWYHLEGHCHTCYRSLKRTQLENIIKVNGTANICFLTIKSKIYSHRYNIQDK